MTRPKTVLGLALVAALVASSAFAQAPANSPRALQNFNANVAAKIKAAVTGQPLPAPANPISSIEQFTLDDLNAAAADAAAQNPPDTRHGPCWTQLAAVVTSINPAGILPKGLGAAQAVQKVFDLQSTFQGHQAWKDQLAMSCALTVADLATDINTLIAKAGLGTVNAALVIPKL